MDDKILFYPPFMTQKRVRNKKIDYDLKYPIYNIDTLKPCKLQDYTEISLNTGMEEEEKEELHLKSALINHESNIPVPQILQLVTSAKKKHSFTHKKSKEYIKYYTDIKNRYVLSEDDNIFMEKNNITENQFYNMIENVRSENEKISIHEIENKRKSILWRYVQEHVLLLHDHGEFNSYACFRKRIIKSLRKSRKVEINVTEKLKRIWSEILSVESMIEMTKNIFMCEKEIFELNKHILDEGVPFLSYKKLRRKLKDRLCNIKRRPVEIPFYKKYTFKELCEDPRKMNEYKYLLHQKKLSSNEIANEVHLLNNI